MAEICIDCINRSRERRGKEPIARYEVRLYTDFCERCGDWRPCILRYRSTPEMLLYPVEAGVRWAWQRIRHKGR